MTQRIVLWPVSLEFNRQVDDTEVRATRHDRRRTCGHPSNTKPTEPERGGSRVVITRFLRVIGPILSLPSDHWRIGLGGLTSGSTTGSDLEDADGVSIPGDAIQLPEGTSILRLETGEPVSVDLHEHAVVADALHRVRAVDDVSEHQIRIELVEISSSPSDFDTGYIDGDTVRVYVRWESRDSLLQPQRRGALTACRHDSHHEGQHDLSLHRAARRSRSRRSGVLRRRDRTGERLHRSSLPLPGNRPS